MMKNYFLLLVILFFAGCTYLENPEKLLKDPNYTTYKEKNEALEHEYLQEKITYPQYLERKKQLEEDYAREAQDVNEKVVGEEK